METKVRTDEEVLQELNDIFKKPEEKMAILDPGLKENGEENAELTKQKIMGEDLPVSEPVSTTENVETPKPQKRKHTGELQRLRAANEHAKQVALMKEEEARMLREEMHRLRNHNEELQQYSQSLKSNYADGILESTEHELAQAVENGDTAKIPEIMARQREINKLMAEQVAEQTVKKYMPQYPQESYNQQTDYNNQSYNNYRNYDQPYNEEYASWLDKTDSSGRRVNSWADPNDEMNYSPELVEEANNFALDLNKMLKKQGLGDRIGTAEYYDIISRAIDKVHGLTPDEGYTQRAPNPEPTLPREPTRPTSYAPVNGGSGYTPSTPSQKYTMNKELAAFVSKLSMLNPDGSEKSPEEKYRIYMKNYQSMNTKN